MSTKCISESLQFEPDDQPYRVVTRELRAQILPTHTSLQRSSDSVWAQTPCPKNTSQVRNGQLTLLPVPSTSWQREEQRKHIRHFPVLLYAVQCSLAHASSSADRDTLVLTSRWNCIYFYAWNFFRLTPDKPYISSYELCAGVAPNTTRNGSNWATYLL